MKVISYVLGVSIVLTLSMNHISFATEDYPNRPLTVICPYSPGGLSDLQARAFAMVAEKYFGKAVVVVNKAGASGMVGVLAVTQADPDGYSVVMAQTAINCNIEGEIAEGRKPPFARQDFTTIGTFSLTGGAITVAYDHPWKTITDLIRDCKARPNYYKYGSAGINGMSWIASELFMMVAGIQCRHVPFKGAGDATTAAIGKHVDFVTAAIGPTVPLREGKKVRMLALTLPKRPRSVPDVPTLRELGFEKADIPIWSGLLAHKKTPENIVKKLREVAEKVAKDKQFVDTIEKSGDEVIFMNGDEFAKYWDAEAGMVAEVYARLIKERKLSK